MSYGAVWVEEMWRPVHQYGWVRTNPEAEEAHLEMLAEKRRVQRTARRAREAARRCTANPQAVGHE